MNEVGALVEINHALINFTHGVQASLLTPEQRAEVRSKLHDLIETNLDDDLFFDPPTDEDAVFDWVDQDGMARSIYVRWDGAYLELGDLYIRIADPFDLNTYLLHSNVVQRWRSDDVDFVLDPVPELVPYGAGDSDALVLKFSMEVSDLDSSEDQSESEERYVTVTNYLQISRADILLFLDGVLPELGRLVLTKIESDKFCLAIKYHHNPRRHRQIPGGLVLQGQEVWQVVERMHGETLALELLDETDRT